MGSMLLRKLPARVPKTEPAPRVLPALLLLLLGLLQQQPAPLCSAAWSQLAEKEGAGGVGGGWKPWARAGGKQSEQGKGCWLVGTSWPHTLRPFPT